MKKLLFILTLFLVSGIGSFSQVTQQQIDAFKGTSTGTNTYSVTINAITATAPYDGQKIWVKFGVANSGASTLKVNSYTAQAITLNGSALASGDIVINQYVSLVYYLSGTSWQIQKPSTAPLTFVSPLTLSTNTVTLSTVTVPFGGTGGTSFTAYSPIFAGTTSTGTFQSGSIGTSGQVLTSNGAGALATFQTVSSGWALNGNTVVSEKWIGTIDNFAFPIRTNNTQRMIIDGDGRVSIGGSVVTDFGFNVSSGLTYLAKFNQTAADHARIWINAPSGKDSRLFFTENNTDAGAFYIGKLTSPSVLAINGGVASFNSSGWLGLSVINQAYNLDILPASNLPSINIREQSAGVTARSTMSFGGNVAGSTGWILGQGSGLVSASSRDFYLFDINTSAYRLNILPSGFVGINQSNPTSNIHIKGFGNTVATSELQVENLAGTVTFKLFSSGVLKFGSSNAFIGTTSGQALTTGNGNVSLGGATLGACTTCDDNTAIGNNALRLSNGAGGIGGGNSAVGGECMQANTVGYDNTAVGFRSLRFNVGGISNVAIGQAAMNASVSGSNNTVVGRGAGILNEGDGCVFLGRLSGSDLTTSSNTLVVDNQARAASATDALVHGVFGTVAAQRFTVNGIIRPGNAQTTTASSTSGDVTFSQPFGGVAYKKIIIYLNASTGTTSYTYPIAFTNTPGIVITSTVGAAVVTSVSTTAVTTTGAATTGFIFLEGY